MKLEDKMLQTCQLTAAKQGLRIIVCLFKQQMILSCELYLTRLDLITDTK
jgi:hypothetical protein